MRNPFNIFSREMPIRNHLAGVLEIGYTHFGPTLSLSGSLIARENLIFINSLFLGVTNLADKSFYQFPWLAFLSQPLSRKHTSVSEMKMPSKFLVAPSAPFAYNIIFSDQDSYALMNPLLKFIKQNWETDDNRHFASWKNLPDRLSQFEAFLKQGFVQEGFSQISEFCYWKPGEYGLDILVFGKENQILLRQKKSFSLNEEEAQGLRGNSGLIIATLCQQPGINFFTVQTPLKERK